MFSGCISNYHQYFKAMKRGLGIDDLGIYNLPLMIVFERVKICYITCYVVTFFLNVL